jgi:hypothetical protein
MPKKYEPFFNYKKKIGNLLIEFNDYDSELCEIYNIFEEFKEIYNGIVRFIINDCNKFEEILPKIIEYREKFYHERKIKIQLDFDTKKIREKLYLSYKRDNDYKYETKLKFIKKFEDKMELYKLIMKCFIIIDDEENICKDTLEENPKNVKNNLSLPYLIEIMKSGRDIKYFFEYIGKINCYQILLDSDLIAKRIYDRDITIYNSLLEDIIINSINEFYEKYDLDIIGLYVAPGGKIIFPNYLLENLEDKNIGLVYIQDSIIHGEYTPFWLKDNYNELLEEFNKKIKKNIPIKIYQYTISNLEKFISKLDTLINKKTAFYLGFTECGKMGRNIYDMNFKNTCVILTGCDGYKLPDQEFFNTDKLYSDLNYKEEDTKVVKDFLGENNNGGNYKKKYIKYKQKYVKLKLNMHLQ